MSLDVPHLLTSEALVGSRQVFAPKSTALAEIECAPEWMHGIIIVARLGRRVHRLIAALENCTTLRNGAERVIADLLSSLPSDRARGRAVVTFPAKKGVIASKLSLTQKHFSRILRGLAISAMVRSEGRTMRIPAQ